jgi:hypothetical protein
MLCQEREDKICQSVVWNRPVAFMAGALSRVQEFQAVGSGELRHRWKRIRHRVWIEESQSQAQRCQCVVSTIILPIASCCPSWSNESDGCWRLESAEPCAEERSRCKGVVDGWWVDVHRGASLALMYVLRRKLINTVTVTRFLHILKVLPLQ